MTIPNSHPSLNDPESGGVARRLRKGIHHEVCIAYTNASQGSFDLAGSNVQARRLASTGLDAVSWLRQEHGTVVLQVTTAQQSPLAGELADAAITNQPNHAICVITADCAPIALWTHNATVGAVHAGWKGLEAGIIELAVEAMRKLSGEEDVYAWLGPCIGPECYEFGEDELGQVERRYGSSVRSTTSQGSTALDLAAGVRAALKNAGSHWEGSAEACTACDPQWFSWRARKSPGRQALFVWREAGDVSTAHQ
jgi:polyphenol oxidase